MTWGPMLLCGSEIKNKNKTKNKTYFLRMESDEYLASVGIWYEWIKFPFKVVAKIWNMNMPDSQNKRNQNKSGL